MNLKFYIPKEGVDWPETAVLLVFTKENERYLFAFTEDGLYPYEISNEAYDASSLERWAKEVPLIEAIKRFNT